MSQKRFNYQLVITLAKKENHARELARILNSNQTTLVRKLNELRSENIVDFKKEGKNKVFFLKKTLEARQAFCASELILLSEFIKKNPLLRSVVEQIQKNKRVELAVLFGSYAKDLATVTSDIDVYLCTTYHPLKETIEKIDSKLSVKIGQYNRNSVLMREIEKNHLIIKGVELFYEKSKLST